MKCGFCGQPATVKGLYDGGTEQMACDGHSFLLDRPREALKKCSRCRGPLECDRSREDVCCPCMDNNYLKDHHLTVLAQAFQELNTIRARDGAPEGVADSYFSSIVDGLDEIMIHLTGKSAHCHPSLYLPYVPVIGAKHERSNFDNTGFYTAEDFSGDSAGQDRIRRD